MARKNLTWEDLDLSNRAKNAIKNMPEYLRESPAALTKKLKEDYVGAIEELLRIPNCGRGTVDEILEEIEFERPQGVGPRLCRFADEDDLLEYLQENDGIEATKLDRSGLITMLGLVSKDWAAPEKDGRYTITRAGQARLDDIRAERPVTLTLKGKLSTIKKLIESLPDDFGEQIDVEMMELELSGRLTVELAG